MNFFEQLGGQISQAGQGFGRWLEKEVGGLIQNPGQYLERGVQRNIIDPIKDGMGITAAERAAREAKQRADIEGAKNLDINKQLDKDKVIIASLLEMARRRNQRLDALNPNAPAATIEDLEKTQRAILESQYGSPNQRMTMVLPGVLGGFNEIAALRPDDSFFSGTLVTTGGRTSAASGVKGTPRGLNFGSPLAPIAAAPARPAPLPTRRGQLGEM